MPPTPESHPRLALGCRLTNAAGTEATLLMPERAMKLNGPGLEIIRRCDGTHSVRDIVAELQGLYNTAPPETIAEETTQFLTRLWEKRALDFD